MGPPQLVWQRVFHDGQIFALWVAQPRCQREVICQNWLTDRPFRRAHRLETYHGTSNSGSIYCSSALTLPLCSLSLLLLRLSSRLLVLARAFFRVSVLLSKVSSFDNMCYYEQVINRYTCGGVDYPANNGHQLVQCAAYLTQVDHAIRNNLEIPLNTCQPGRSTIENKVPRPCTGTRPCDRVGIPQYATFLSF